MDINFYLNHKDAKLPQKATERSAAWDLYSCHAFAIAPGQTVVVDTGLIGDFPPGWGGFVFSRSGLASKLNIHLVNGVGVWDEDYKETWKCVFYRDYVEKHFMLENEDLVAPAKYEVGTRIAQIIFLNLNDITVKETNKITMTNRGGFGSTGLK